MIAGYKPNKNLAEPDSNFPIEMLEQFTQILPVDFMGDDNGIASAFTPDVLKPIVQSLTNRDWTGKPIYKDSEYNKYDPEWKKVYKGEFAPAVSLSKWINEWSGGTSVSKGSADTKYNNPAIWDNIISGYTGGAGSDIMRFGKIAKNTYESVKSAAQGKTDEAWSDFSARQVPMIRAFYSTPTEKSKYYRALNRYYKYREEAKKYEHDLKAWENSEIPTEQAKAIHAYQTMPPEFRRMVYIQDLEKAVKDARAFIKDESQPKKDRDAMQEMVNQMMIEAVSEFEK